MPGLIELEPAFEWVVFIMDVGIYFKSLPEIRLDMRTAGG